MSEEQNPEVQMGTIEYVAKNNDGIKLVQTGDQWYNYGGVDKTSMQEKVSGLNQGDEVTLVLIPGEERKYADVLVDRKATPKTSSAKNSFMEDYKGIEDLLSEAHEMVIGDLKITTDLLEVDQEKKTAVAKATVQGVVGFFGAEGATPTLDKRLAQGIGDASPESIGTKNIEPHFIRMAETRAIVRALRWFTNNGATGKEELPVEDSE